jgi:hypothetical protein
MVDSCSLILAFLCPSSHLFFSDLEPSAASQAPATDHRDGVRPLVLLHQHIERSQEAEAGDWVAVTGVQWEDVAWGHFARRHMAWQFHLLRSVCPVRARAPILLLPFHAPGALRSLAPALVAALHHTGDDLHAPLQDVHVCVDISAPVLVLPRAALFQKEPSSHRWLLLLAPDQGSICVHCHPQP